MSDAIRLVSCGEYSDYSIVCATTASVEEIAAAVKVARARHSDKHAYYITMCKALREALHGKTVPVDEVWVDEYTDEIQIKKAGE